MYCNEAMLQQNIPPQETGCSRLHEDGDLRSSATTTEQEL